MFVVVVHLFVTLRHGLGLRGAEDSDLNRELNCKELTTQSGRQAEHRVGARTPSLPQGIRRRKELFPAGRGVGCCLEEMTSNLGFDCG